MNPFSAPVLHRAPIASLTFFLSLSSAFAAPADSCTTLLKRDPGYSLLHEQNSQLHTSANVSTATRGTKQRLGSPLQKPGDKLEFWLERLNLAYQRTRGVEKPREVIRKYYLDRYTTQRSEVPESFFELQLRIAREQGHGNIKLTQADRDRIAEIAIQDQRNSLASWIDYFLSSDADIYPTWTKYWSFNALVKMGKYDPETGLFSSRSKGQMGLFPELNREAFALVIDQVAKLARKESLNDLDNPEFLKSIQTKSFSRAYGQALRHLTEQAKRNSSLASRTEGEWIKYPKGSDPMPLVRSLEGHSTGWCTAGESTARTQLQNGDFYVYYSFDQNGKPTIPRTGIRMEGSRIAEVRGVASNQNLDPEIAASGVVDRKLKEFGKEGEAYEKRSSDMRRLTQIEKKASEGEKLSLEDLRFLYQLDRKIQGFGYEADPRIQEIISKRDAKKDLSQVFECRPEQISLTHNEALKGNILYHYGDLNLYNLTSAEGLVLPKAIVGSLSLGRLTSAKGLVLPKAIGGGIYLNSLTSAKGLVLPNSIGGDIYLNNLTSAEGLVLPNSIGGGIYLNSLTSAEGLVLPNSIGGDIYLSRLTSAEGLVLPKSIGGALFLDSLTSAEGIVLPNSIGGDLDLGNLTSAKGLVLPKSIGGSIYLSSLTSAEGLVLPNSIGENLNLYRLTSAKGLVLPKSIGGGIYLNRLTDSELIKIDFSALSDDFKIYLECNEFTAGELKKMAHPR